MLDALSLFGIEADVLRKINFKGLMKDSAVKKARKIFQMQVKDYKNFNFFVVTEIIEAASC